MSFKKPSLFLKLMLPINLVVFFIMLALGAEMYMTSSKSTEELTTKEMKTLADSMAIGAMDFYVHPNPAELKHIVDKLNENETVEAVIFSDQNGKVLVENHSQHEESSLLKVKKEIIAEDKKLLGHIEILYNQDTNEKLKKENFNIIILFVFISQLVLGLLSFYIIRKVIQSLGEKTSQLQALSLKTKESALSAKNVSEQVSNSTNEQAASIQETVATLDEISSQVSATVENVQNSAKKAEESYSAATEGKNVVHKMIDSMEEIEKSNVEIMEEIAKGNERISGIVKIINEIGQKTAVINDIVFQTKLLSFNASVEAARAGEHGKGFAVVAEEVGNLAQMSGKASTEISEILDESIKTVNSVINETNENVKKLVLTGNVKVKNGTEVAHQCGKILDEVVGIAVVVKNMMNEVSIASKDQADGVKNIATAMNQLDQTTLNNNRVATISLENSKSLTDQSAQLQETLSDLDAEIFGNKGNRVELKKSDDVSKKTSLKMAPAVASSKSSSVKDKIASSASRAPSIPPKASATKNEQPKKAAEKSNVIALPAKAETKTKIAIVEKKKEEAPKPAKSTTSLPSYDDPRFEDV